MGEDETARRRDGETARNDTLVVVPAPVAGGRPSDREGGRSRLSNDKERFLDKVEMTVYRRSLIDVS
jgi:hypothetical protein